MIIFLSFAPIEFMGGAERWFKGVAEETSKFEEVYLLTVSSSIADIYGRMVLKRSFSDNLNPVKVNGTKVITLNFEHFLPFTSQNKEIKNIFKKSRLIYIKFEVLEVVISIYFGGKNILNKIIAGIHSPLYYHVTQSFFQRLHNNLYTSSLYKFFIKRTHKVHVLNKRDEAFMKEKFKLLNVVQVYDGVNMKKTEKFNEKFNKKELKIITVGELSLRKGIDIVSQIIQKSPDTFLFSVVGDGPFKNDIKSLVKEKNCNYFGYIHGEKELHRLYKEQDVLLFPSRAETLGLVMLEAMSCGLKIVNSKEVELNIPNYIEYTSKVENSDEYIQILNKIFNEKQANSIDKYVIHEYAYKTFSNDIICPEFLKKVLDITNN